MTTDQGILFALIAAPIARDVAERLQVTPDPFLMAIAVAASCAFLTPIGHKNNTLIMGPGGYGFGDYWRMRLPLEILVVATAIPNRCISRCVEILKLNDN